MKIEDRNLKSVICMKKTSVICLLAIAAVVGWASLETFRLWEATSRPRHQHLHLRTSAVEAARTKQTQVVHRRCQSSSAAQK
jgi:hypothetical protein